MVILYFLSFFAAFALAIVLTPFVKRFALWIGAVDRPNHRKVHTVVMPRLGGLGIFFSFICAFVIISPALPDVEGNVIWGLLLGGAVIVLIGALDDKFELSAKIKLLGQLAAAGIVVAFGLTINVGLIDFPFESGWLDSIGGWISIPLTILWIVGVTNAINLIDGLDGLAGGVSAIATATMLALALMMGNITVVLLCAILLGSILGFLVFNFHPAKIFMGDSGALFLGFSLATLSVLGFKQATMISFVVPLLVLGVPLSDTLFAIIRRVVNKKPISVADKSHLHHSLLRLGLSHRNTVLVIYGLSIVFGICAIALSRTTYIWSALAIIFIVLFLLEITVEVIFSKRRRPVLQFLRKVSVKTARLIGARSMK